MTISLELSAKSKTASGQASWRPTGAQDGLWTGLLAPKTALNGSLIAQDGLWTRFLALDVFALLIV